MTSVSQKSPRTAGDVGRITSLKVSSKINVRYKLTFHSVSHS